MALEALPPPRQRQCTEIVQFRVVGMGLQASAYEFEPSGRMTGTNQCSAEGTIAPYILLPRGRVSCPLVCLQEGQDVCPGRVHLLQESIDERTRCFRLFPWCSRRARRGDSVLAAWIEPIPERDDGLQRFHHHETIVLLLGVWQRGIRHQARVLFL